MKKDWDEVSGWRILALLGDAFGGFGGIAAYNRDLIEAWCADVAVAQVIAIPRSADGPVGELPRKLKYALGGTKGGAAFCAEVVRQALTAKSLDLIFCGHVNLAPLALLVAKLTGKPWVLQTHGVEAWTASPKWAVRLASSRADHFFAVSRLTLERFRELHGLPEERLTQTPLALRLEAFGTGPKNAALARRYGLEGRKVIMTFGRMSSGEQYKGFDEIIEILPRLVAARPDIMYLAAGEGDDRPRLEAKAASLGVSDHVVFTGPLDEGEKLDIYRLADVYAMPSRGEGFGFVLLEAMACGIPTVASTIDGGQEALRNGMLGRLVDPAEPAAIERAILESIDLPKAIPAGMDFFDFPNFARRIQAATHKILNSTSVEHQRE